MPHRLLGILAVGLLCSTACVAQPEDDHGDASIEAITSSPSVARARQVRDAYLAAQISAFEPVKLAALPGAARLVSETEAGLAGSDRCTPDATSLEVRGFGKVFVVEERGSCAFVQLIVFDASGSALCAAVPITDAKGTHLTFWLPTVAQGRITLLSSL